MRGRPVSGRPATGERVDVTVADASATRTGIVLRRVWRRSCDARAAMAAGSEESDVFCAATTPTAARPRVTSAAMTSDDDLHRSLHRKTNPTRRELKAQSRARVNGRDAMKRERENCGFPALSGAALSQCSVVSAVESVLPACNRAGKGKRRRLEHTARDRPRHDIGSERAKLRQPDERIGERPAPGRAANTTSPSSGVCTG